MLCQEPENLIVRGLHNELSVAVCAPSRNLVQIENAAYRLKCRYGSDFLRMYGRWLTCISRRYMGRFHLCTTY